MRRKFAGMAFIQTDAYTLRNYECDAAGRLSIPALMNLMQESANRNAYDYGIDSETLQANGLGWMLMRFGLVMHHYPRSGQTIRIVTYPTGVEKFFVYRDFRVYADAVLLAEATSTWLVFDSHKRTMVPTPDFIRSLVCPDVDQPSPRLPLKPNYPSVEVAEEAQAVTVGWFDIDSNQHVNNVVYIRWLLEQLPDAVLQTQELAELDVVYRNETHWHERVLVQHQADDAGTFHHRLALAETGKDVLLARTRWRR
ncbi:acyl-[acyl-carrier-protein] thioesterase [Fibrella aestuarina]|uniref:acyl-[acyl-carrier-protein] thioesterase n=1 Tax=Fibrella aestuarina TaxID=651143 RepID=UPI001E32AF9C|nr:acyl-ACP thioesterase domain-containing protein [Fibrella aestuarina]